MLAEEQKGAVDIDVVLDFPVVVLPGRDGASEPEIGIGHPVEVFSGMKTGERDVAALAPFSVLGPFLLLGRDVKAQRVGFENPSNAPVSGIVLGFRCVFKFEDAQKAVFPVGLGTDEAYNRRITVWQHRGLFVRKHPEFGRKAEEACILAAKGELRHLPLPVFGNPPMDQHPHEVDEQDARHVFLPGPEPDFGLEFRRILLSQEGFHPLGKGDEGVAPVKPRGLFRLLPDFSAKPDLVGLAGRKKGGQMGQGRKAREVEGVDGRPFPVGQKGVLPF